MGVSRGGKIVTNDLVFCLDFGSKRCYTSGTTANDLAGSNDGTLTNGPIFNDENGGSIFFDGANDYVEIPEATISSLGVTNGGPVTLITTFKASASEQGMIFAFSDSPRCYIETFVQNGSLVVHWGLGGTNSSTTSTAFIETGKIYHYATCYDGSTVKTYLNSDPRDEKTNMIAGSYNTNSLRIGKYTNGFPLYFNGNVYNCSIYNRSLSQEEIKQNYNSTRGRFE